MKTRISQRQWQQLSEYLDNQLSSRERERLETQLAKDQGLRDAIEELRRTRTILRAPIQRRAPRNFTLTPAQAGVRGTPRAYPVFRLASALAGILFVIVLLGDLLIPAPQATSLPVAEERFAAGVVTEEAGQLLAQDSAASAGAALEPAVEAARVEATVLVEEALKAAEAPPPSASEPTSGLDTSQKVMPTATQVVEGVGALEAPATTPPLEMTPTITESLAMQAMTETEAITQTEAALNMQVEEAETAPLERERSQETGAQPGRNLDWLRLVEVTLLLFAVLAGGIAFVIRRSSG